MATSKKSTESTPRNPMELPTLDELKSLIGQFKLPGVDVNALAEWQRKDLEALAEANRQAYEGMKALAQRRTEMLREALTEWQENLKESTGKDAFAKQSEAAQRGMQQALDNFRELAEMEAQARNDAWKVVQERINENMANLQKLLPTRRS
ncbi:phasin family protein [Verticiella sediminum]|uniref:Phasin family protein n=1 Tax=Verticiella sediminum TaxID=1247510 RepID=A0A556AVF6_9BURK|nr:phasin family protein [Verticiella sediminum]TSH96933.1 phasin family protein [Verticiella sediminum]